MKVGTCSRLHDLAEKGVCVVQHHSPHCTATAEFLLQDTSRSSIGWAKCAKRSRASGSLSCNASLRPCSSLRLRSSRLLPSNRGGPAQQGSYQDQACRNVQAVSLWPSSTSNSSDRSRGRTQDR